MFLSQIEFHVYGRSIVNGVWKPASFASLNKLYYVYSGRANYGDKKLISGHLYLLSDKCLNSNNICENFDHLYFDYFINPPLNITDCVDIDLIDHADIKSVCDAASTVFLKNNMHEIHNIAANFLDILLRLCDMMVPLRFINDDLITAAINYVCARLDQKITISELADYTHLNEYYFIRLFKQCTGKSPHNYIRELKLNRAVIMLENGVNLSTVSETIGFSSEASFSGSFRKRFGVPPGKIKKYEKV